MIKGLFETHIYVENLERSIEFYSNVLGLIQCHYEEERRIAFFWVGKPREAMLGIWEKPKTEIDIRHFAFRCEVDDVLNKSVQFLESKNLQPYNFLKSGNHEPMVFAWMPALAIYFNDPDGHALEFIAILEGEAKPELGVISYSEWMSAN
ncbi:VOC family protein [Pedobacter alluvionis]|uniref:Catechol 2,3-dioxygenase-like lactoylglutathione lyase family enzyme n=1 Tax=Pedobacter alluvionis TaxID=475253 RepID=A0A497Y6Q9_9SPHI|nr:VOC family protein [Pedobacter alluvionis]RLJ77495.1 catechol 2,3-dioxygenase-like lactoylglutathione lyase family enzyme [Pedobacter alluvionis]TFB33291.1 VOC family protein [Pedobacter alluvionis]